MWTSCVTSRVLLVQIYPTHPNSLSKPVSRLFPHISIQDPSIANVSVGKISFAESFDACLLLSMFRYILSQLSQHFLAGDTQVEDMTNWGLWGCEGLTGKINHAWPLKMFDLQKIIPIIWSKSFCFIQNNFSQFLRCFLCTRRM